MLSPPGSPPKSADTAPSTAAPAPAPAGPSPAARPDRRGGWLIVLALLCTAPLVLHAHLPNRVGNLGSLVQTLLPWVGLGVPVLLALSLGLRSRRGAAATLLPAVVWAALFTPELTDRSGARGGTGTLTVLSHNVDEDNPEPVRTARALAAADADLLALEELPRDPSVYVRELAAYPYHRVHGGVGLWSRYRLTEVAPVEIMPWTRAVRATVHTPKGPVAVYAAHLASVRVSPFAGFTTGRRDEAGRLLAEAVRAEPLDRVVVLGDFNGTHRDRALAPLTSGLRSAQREAGDGFGFTWPAAFPVVRIDDVLVRGLAPQASWTLPATGSDHLPVAAALRP
ncbi:endonuclease/exonuclease/phosphatase family protein [Streptomyces sp. NPDC002490]|uniref:endonuclease/exonuclease/phosphatase family protein n=1 Tax=Streptomyces sp. NPDC002490 TaxID=3154416 RepID=UPI003316AD6A